MTGHLEAPKKIRKAFWLFNFLRNIGETTQYIIESGYQELNFGD